jgi:hypothetical protein
MSAPVMGVSGGQGIRRRHGRAEHNSSENDHQISAVKDGHRMFSRVRQFSLGTWWQSP